MKIPAILIAAICLGACGARSSDAEKVRSLVASLEAAAEDRDAGDVLEHVADEYADNSGFDKSRLANFLRAYFLAHRKIELRVSIESLEFPADGLAQARLTVTRLSLEDPGRQQLQVELRRHQGEWRIVRADRVAR